MHLFMFGFTIFIKTADNFSFYTFFLLPNRMFTFLCQKINLFNYLLTRDSNSFKV